MGREQPGHGLPSKEQQSKVLRQHGDAELRQPVLASAEDLALATQREIDLGELEAVALALDCVQANPGALGSSAGKQNARRFVLPAPDPTRTSKLAVRPKKVADVTIFGVGGGQAC